MERTRGRHYRRSTHAFKTQRRMLPRLPQQPLKESTPLLLDPM
jgi:hypothetical protein